MWPGNHRPLRLEAEFNRLGATGPLERAMNNERKREYQRTKYTLKSIHKVHWEHQKIIKDECPNN